MFDAAIAARFWSKVDQSGGSDACWPWLGGRKPAGYGNFFVKRETPGQHGRMVFMNAHKMAYILTYGPLDDGQLVRHKCDNPPCCNPAHLVPGNGVDNVRDAIERGRWDPAAGGQKALPALLAYNTARRSLTEQDIAAIIVARANKRSLRSIAGDYGVTESTISGVFEGKAYRDVPVVQQVAALYQQGIRFPYPGRAPVPTALRDLAAEISATMPHKKAA